MWKDFLAWLQGNMLSCFYKKHLGIECPGCGSQRALLLLLKGRFIQSFEMYPPLFLVLSLLLFCGLHLVFKFRKGGKVIKYLAIATGVSMFLNYLYKIA